MKILHTADWHIGQLFHEYDRSYEHQQFMDWLVNALITHDIEALLVSGDVFDNSNPAAASVKMFYSFLNKATRQMPHLQIIVTAGNHDSPSRLESPKPLLESSNIHIVGMVERGVEGDFNYDKLVIPLKNKAGQPEILCLAVPYLRQGEYPKVEGCSSAYAEGVEAFYKEIYQHTLTQKEPSQSVIAMGHLHTQKADTVADDTFDRAIMGGVDCISDSAFHSDLCYVALGHIHKAQKIGGREHIRYSGSPLPLSFSEINYRHKVIVFEIEDGKLFNLQEVEVPISVPLIQLPAKHQPVVEVLAAIQSLPEMDTHLANAPFVEIRVLEDGPDPTRKFRIQEALKGKKARLAKISVRAADQDPLGENVLDVQSNLQELKPIGVFLKHYKRRYATDAPADLVDLFNEVANGINQ